jgi:DNA-binding NarL/FixJ family response regulator
VVVAEDHPAMATELHVPLIIDYDIVEIAHDGVARIDATRRALPDAIVCDIAMPRVNGLAAAASILATRPDARIVFVTVQDSRAVVEKAIDCGVGGFNLSANARRILGTTERPTASDEDGS